MVKFRAMQLNSWPMPAAKMLQDCHAKCAVALMIIGIELIKKYTHRHWLSMRLFLKQTRY